MRKWLQALDSILRGEATDVARLRDGQIDVPAGGLTTLIVLLGAAYGFCMGWFALLNRDEPEFRQLAASVVKVPALFLLTLLVTFPSLYVFNSLVGSRLSAAALSRLLVASLGLTLAVLASFGPVVAFFSLTTDSYPFMVLLNVVVFAAAGLLGLRFVFQTLHRLTLPRPRAAPPPAPVSAAPEPAEGGLEGIPEALPAEPPGALERVGEGPAARKVKVVFLCWVVVFAVVGAQMSWVLRPFVGDPDRAFTWFRPRESHFFEAVWRAVVQLFT